jgi:hypothetical protein
VRTSLRTTAGWLLPLMYLALPNCTLDTTGLPSDGPSDGRPPLNNAIYCDVEKPVPRECAATQDPDGIYLSEAALALVNGETTQFVLDGSPGARTLCPNNEPQVIEYLSPFPKGSPKCLNCGNSVGPGLTFESEHAACVSKCVEMLPGQDAFCADGARVSTNANNACADPAFQNACTDGGMESPDFLDPRLLPEPVEWRDVSTSAEADGNSLKKKLVMGTGAFDEGAASVQRIKTGDGYVEFKAVAVDTARAGGLSVGDVDDMDATLAGIGFAVRLSPAGDVFIHESGVEQVGDNPNGSFATYASGDRIRVTFTDNYDGTATIGYVLIPVGCQGAPCAVSLRTAGPADYPLRVDASLRTPGAVLDDVLVVFIR